MSFTEVETRHIFPTPFIMASFPDDVTARLQAELVPFLMKKSDIEPTANITNIGGWQSDTRIVEWGGEPVALIVKSLIELIDQATLDLHQKGFHSDVKWKVYGWANINRKGHMNVYHTHPGAMWSAACYLQTDDAAMAATSGGEFQVLDPRGTMPIMYAPQLRIGIDGFQSCGGHELHTPKAGQCFLFPSWLPHAVMPYKGDGTRISLAFNFSV